MYFRVQQQFFCFALLFLRCFLCIIVVAAEGGGSDSDSENDEDFTISSDDSDSDSESDSELESEGSNLLQLAISCISFHTVRVAQVLSYFVLTV